MRTSESNLRPGRDRRDLGLRRRVLEVKFVAPELGARHVCHLHHNLSVSTLLHPHTIIRRTYGPVGVVVRCHTDELPVLLTTRSAQGNTYPRGRTYGGRCAIGDEVRERVCVRRRQSPLHHLNGQATYSVRLRVARVQRRGSQTSSSLYNVGGEDGRLSSPLPAAFYTPTHTTRNPHAEMPRRAWHTQGIRINPLPRAEAQDSSRRSAWRREKTRGGHDRARTLGQSATTGKKARSFLRGRATCFESRKNTRPSYSLVLPLIASYPNTRIPPTLDNVRPRFSAPKPVIAELIPRVRSDGVVARGSGD